MRNLFTNSSFRIDAGTARSGITSRRQTLQIVSGSVWLTVEGEAQDYWLAAGDTFDVTPDRLVVMEADHDACCIEASAPAQSGIVAAFTALLAGTWRTWRHVFADRIGSGAAHVQNTAGACTCTCRVR